MSIHTLMLDFSEPYQDFSGVDMNLQHNKDIMQCKLEQAIK